MLFIFTCKRCKAVSAVDEKVFDRFLPEDVGKKKSELLKDPHIKALRLEFQEGCPTCMPSDSHPLVRLLATRDKRRLTRQE